ncbi:unnamed protein product, partial [Ectocarpus sp. 13 AM-2016]
MVATALLAVSAVASAAAASNAGGVGAGAGLPAFASPPTVDVGRTLGSWATAAAAGAAGGKSISRHAENLSRGVIRRRWVYKGKQQQQQQQQHGEVAVWGGRPSLRLKAEATGVAFGGEGRAMDRAAQAESKYREALEEALRAAREHGDSSPQAVAAWDIVDEIEASNNSIAWRPALDQACSVAGEGD